MIQPQYCSTVRQLPWPDFQWAKFPPTSVAKNHKATSRDPTPPHIQFNQPRSIWKLFKELETIHGPSLHQHQLPKTTVHNQKPTIYIMVHPKLFQRRRHSQWSDLDYPDSMFPKAPPQAHHQLQRSTPNISTQWETILSPRPPKKQGSTHVVC